MKALVIYDSAYGNTEEVAKVVGRALGEGTRIERVGDADWDDLKQYELVVVGSPTQAGRPTPAVKAFLKNIPAGSLKGVEVSGFDTRIDSQAQGFMLRTFMGFLGYAAGRIARQLEAKGGRLVKQPHGFFVQDKEGPLSEGELERAADWASSIARAKVSSE
ncbi:MAG TPA: flavodoxin family protein [Dehalococcoidia bacterium]|nr:flavodoxin family protein [Dehalococcoidia bacterium]